MFETLAVLWEFVQILWLLLSFPARIAIPMIASAVLGKVAVGLLLLGSVYGGALTAVMRPVVRRLNPAPARSSAVRARVVRHRRRAHS